MMFLLALAAAGSGALIAALSTRVIRSVCGLAICCLGLSGLYWFLHSPFLAMMEILIYVGAVCVTIVFAIMLAEPDEPAQEEPRKSALIWTGVSLTVALALFCGLAHLGVRGNWQEAQARTTDGSIREIGISLLTTYSAAFEMISLVLLIAILGALVIARGGREHS